MEQIITAALTLILVMDPFGNIPAFASILGQVDEKRRPWVLLREMLIALAVLLIFLFFGKYMLSAMHLSNYSLELAGGVILFMIALRMVFPPAGGVMGVSDERDKEPFIIPLAIPLIAGPSAMATVILMSSTPGVDIWIPAAATTAAWLISAVILMGASFLEKVLGKRVLRAVERLMGMLLTTLAVEMLLSGITGFMLAKGII